jgi:hypothetical protein
MASNFDRTLSQMESTVRRLANEKSARKEREEKLALHNLATARQNANSDRLRNLGLANQEIINRGHLANAALQREHDLGALETGRITPEQFNIRHGGNVNSEKVALAEERTINDAYNTYLGKMENIDPKTGRHLNREEFKSQYFPKTTAIGSNTPLAKIGTNDITETSEPNVGYGKRSFTNVSPKVKGVEGWAIVNGEKIRVIRGEDNNFYNASDGALISGQKTDEVAPVPQKTNEKPRRFPIPKATQEMTQEVEKNPFTDKDPRYNINDLTQKYTKIFNGVGPYDGNIYGKTSDGKVQLILNKQEQNQPSLINPETGEPVRNPKYDQYMEILNYINQNNN